MDVAQPSNQLKDGCGLGHVNHWPVRAKCPKAPTIKSTLPTPHSHNEGGATARKMPAAAAVASSHRRIRELRSVKSPRDSMLPGTQVKPRRGAAWTLSETWTPLVGRMRARSRRVRRKQRRV